MTSKLIRNFLRTTKRTVTSLVLLVLISLALGSCASTPNYSKIYDVEAAASEGNIEFINEYIARGGELDDTEALYKAAQAEQIDTVRFLLDSGAYIDETSRDTGETALTAAIKARNLEIAELLLGARAIPNRHEGDGEIPLLVATQNSDIEAIRLLLKEEAWPNIKSGIWGETPLISAINSTDKQVVQILLEAGASPDYRNENHDTPLYRAVVIGEADLVTMLLEHKADPNRPGASRKRPLWSAANNGHQDIVEILLKFDADPLLDWPKGRGSLEDGIYTSYPEIAATIDFALPVVAESKPDPEARDHGYSKSSSGTGFFVSSEGHVVTAAHVVDSCLQIQIRQQGEIYEATRKAFDVHNDLGLLAVELTSSDYARFVGSSAPRLGESIVVYGFPLASVLSSYPKVTEGSISSVAGMEDDTRFYQISAPIQPGNSGGPVFDMYGSIVGVVTSKLSDEWAMRNAGVVPQNVNFALKSSVVETFLDVNKIQFSTSPQSVKMDSTPDVVTIADKVTVQVICNY